MIRCFFRNSNKLEVITDLEAFEANDDKKSKVVWLDMLLPTHEEISFVENTFGIDFPTKQESEEIETSSRYWEEDKKIEILQNDIINEIEILAKQIMMKTTSSESALKINLFFKNAYMRIRICSKSIFKTV